MSYHILPFFFIVFPGLILSIVMIQHCNEKAKRLENQRLIDANLKHNGNV